MESKDEVVSEIENYKRERQREREARVQAEQLLEDKTRELYLANKELTKKYEQLERYTNELSLFLSLSKFSQEVMTITKALQFYETSN